MRSPIYLRLTLTVLLALFFNLPTTQPVLASDHIDGPVTVRHPVADITDLYAFPSPDHPGHLVLVMDVYTGVPAQGHFSEKVAYNFLVRNASIRGDGQSGFSTQGDYKLSVSFETPHDRNTSHWVTCTSSTGTTVRVKVDDTNSFALGDKLGVFAGRRSDPFFYNSGWGSKVIQGNLTEPSNTNLLAHLNVLSILVIIDVEQELDLSQGSFLAVAAQSVTTDVDGTTRQIDRLGRPEMTNIVMASKGREDIRDIYNEENPFDLNPGHANIYRERIHGNLLFFDSLNMEQRWSPQQVNILTEILLNDYLVIDASKPYAESSYFEIENALLRGEIHATAGGRSLNDDAIDVLFTMLVNGGQLPQLKDGVTQATQPATDNFPYLAPPNGGVVARFLAYATRGVRYFTADPAAVWIGIGYFAPAILAVIAILVLLFYLIGFRKHSPKVRRGLLLTMSVLFLLSGILGAINSTYSIGVIILFVLLGAVLFWFYLKTKRD
ncbi:MAG: DUF4331 family protein [Bacteroidota bacterium]